MNSQHNESQLLSQNKKPNQTKEIKRLGAVTTASPLTSHLPKLCLPALTPALRDKETMSFTTDRFVCWVRIWQSNVLFVFGGWEGWVVQKWKTWPEVIWSLDSAPVKYKSYFWTSSNCMRGEASQTNKTKNNGKKLIPKDPWWRFVLKGKSWNSSSRNH